MFGWIREWRKQRMFDQGFARAAEQKYKEGKILSTELDKCLKASKNKDIMKRARRQLTADPNMLGGINWDWEAIFQWFIEYFIPALKIILPLFLLQPNE